MSRRSWRFVFAMGGTGYALTLPKNSVGSKQIRKNAVTGAKVAHRTLRASDFARGQLPAGPSGAPGLRRRRTGRPRRSRARGAQGVQGVRRRGGRGHGAAHGLRRSRTTPRPEIRLLPRGDAGRSAAALRSIAIHRQRHHLDGLASGPHGASRDGEAFDGWRVSCRNVLAGANRRPCTRSRSARRTSPGARGRRRAAPRSGARRAGAPSPASVRLDLHAGGAVDAVRRLPEVDEGNARIRSSTTMAKCWAASIPLPGPRSRCRGARRRA